MIRIFFVLLIFFGSKVLVSQVAGQWTWVSGYNYPNSTGVFGVQGVPDPVNAPPGMYEACEWTDSGHNFWVFGGLTTNGVCNSFFKYDIVLNQWAWMGGSTTQGQAGTYGTQGVPSVTNVPGARGWGVMSWSDKLGNLWLFGGYGYDASGTMGLLSDMWKYTIATGEWTWMAGPNTTLGVGVYGSFRCGICSQLSSAS
jgi:hypothetical protein